MANICIAAHHVHSSSLLSLLPQHSCCCPKQGVCWPPFTGVNSWTTDTSFLQLYLKKSELFLKGLEQLPHFASNPPTLFWDDTLDGNRALIQLDLRQTVHWESANVNLMLNLCCILLNLIKVLYIRRCLLYTYTHQCECIGTECHWKDSNSACLWCPIFYHFAKHFTKCLNGVDKLDLICFENFTWIFDTTGAQKSASEIIFLNFPGIDR